MTRRRIALPIVMVVLGLAVGLAVGEAAFRLVGSRPHKYMVSDPILHHRFLPNARGRVRGVELTTNSLGLRDREIVVARSPGTFRILMLGDSFTEGGGLALDDTVAKRVERTLNGGSCRRRYEVINGGVASYSPILEYLFLKHVGLPLAPDLVTLNFDMTDVHDDVIRTAVAQLGADRLPLAVPPDRRREGAVLLPPVARSRGLRFLDPLLALLNRSKLYQEFRGSAVGQRLFGSLVLTPERLEGLGLVGNIQYDIEAITRDGDSPELDEAWRLTERYITATHALARAHHIPLMLVVYPHAQQVAASASLEGRRRHGLGPGLYTSRRPFDILESLGQREGFPVVNLLGLFREREPTEGPLFWPDDIHHTPAGARVFAEGIVAGLVEHDLIGCSPVRR